MKRQLNSRTWKLGALTGGWPCLVNHFRAVIRCEIFGEGGQPITTKSQNGSCWVGNWMWDYIINDLVTGAIFEISGKNFPQNFRSIFLDFPLSSQCHKSEKLPVLIRANKRFEGSWLVNEKFKNAWNICRISNWAAAENYSKVLPLPSMGIGQVILQPLV